MMKHTIVFTTCSVLFAIINSVEAQVALKVLSESEHSFYVSQGLLKSDSSERDLIQNLGQWLATQSGRELNESETVLSLRIIIQAADVGFNEHSFGAVKKTSLASYRATREADIFEELGDATKRKGENEEGVESTLEVIRILRPDEATPRIDVDGVFVRLSPDREKAEGVDVVHTSFELRDNVWTSVNPR